MMERQWVYCAIEVEFESSIDSGINKCNVKHRVSFALSTVNPPHIHWPMSCLNEFRILKDKYTYMSVFTFVTMCAA